MTPSPWVAHLTGSADVDGVLFDVHREADPDGGVTWWATATTLPGFTAASTDEDGLRRAIADALPEARR